MSESTIPTDNTHGIAPVIALGAGIFCLLLAAALGLGWFW